MAGRTKIQKIIDKTTGYFDLLNMLGYAVAQGKDEFLCPEDFNTEIKALVERLDHLITTDTLED